MGNDSRTSSPYMILYVCYACMCISIRRASPLPTEGDDREHYWATSSISYEFSVCAPRFRVSFIRAVVVWRYLCNELSSLCCSRNTKLVAHDGFDSYCNVAISNVIDVLNNAERLFLCSYWSIDDDCSTRRCCCCCSIHRQPDTAILFHHT